MAAKQSTSRGHGKQAPQVKAKNVTPDEARFIAEHADQLSKTTQSAKWLHTSREHEDQPGQSLATRSHEVIRHWAEERGGRPATVPGTEYDGHPGVLRFNFPSFGGRALKDVSWNEWFGTFDNRELVFVFQEHKRNGTQSNFFRFDSPHREHA